MSKTNLSELYELSQAHVPPVSNIKFHSWEQITTPGNQTLWQGKLTATLRDWEVPMKEETIEAQGTSKKAVQNELARQILEIISETFKRPSTYIPAYFRHEEMAPKLPTQSIGQSEATRHFRALNDPESSAEDKQLAYTWLKENFDPTIF